MVHFRIEGRYCQRFAIWKISLSTFLTVKSYIMNVDMRVIFSAWRPELVFEKAGVKYDGH